MHLGPLPSAGKEAAAGAGVGSSLSPSKQGGLVLEAGWPVGPASWSPSLEQLPSPQRWMSLPLSHYLGRENHVSGLGVGSRECSGGVWGRRRGLGPAAGNGLEERMGGGGRRWEKKEPAGSGNGVVGRRARESTQTN